MIVLTADDVVAVHESVIHPHELQGKASGKSVEGVVSRIDTRLAYGLIDDIFQLAACYGVFISVAHVFNDANKRTAFACMDTVLALNSIDLVYDDHEAAGDMIRKVVLGQIDENDLRDWLAACPQIENGIGA